MFSKILRLVGSYLTFVVAVLLVDAISGYISYQIWQFYSIGEAVGIGAYLFIPWVMSFVVYNHCPGLTTEEEKGGGDPHV